MRSRRPIAPQSLTKEIPERCDYAGAVLLPLDRDAVREAARELKDAGVESIAVCYLFSFMNPAHEEETRALIQEAVSRRPRLAVERGAAAHPRMGAAVDDAAQCLSRAGAWCATSTISTAGLDAAGVSTQQRFLMQSNGGVMPFSAAIAGGRTVHTLFSGPAGGRAGERLSGARGRAARPRHPRHGRHQRRHRLHRRRRAARSRPRA